MVIISHSHAQLTYMQKGKTALHYADEEMKFSCVIALLGAGAAPFIKDKVVFVCIFLLLLCCNKTLYENCQEGKPAMEADGVMMTLVKALIDSNNNGMIKFHSCCTANEAYPATTA
jgi:hypothetical protein